VSARDDTKRLRVRDDAIVGDLSAAPYLADPGTPCLVAQTTKVNTYPTSAQSFFACSPVAVLGAEVEGGQATLTALLPVFFALNLGGAIPAQGTDVIASFVGNRWVFRYDA
jgi:hypothetical protein